MNELHLKYQQDTGIQISKEINLIRYHSDFKYLYDYIQWLEEQIETNEKNKNQTSKPDYDRNRNR